MDQRRTPLFTALVEHARRKPVQFHIPGHKAGAGADPEFRQFLGEAAFAIDLINISPLDDLHHPQGIIREAQRLAAQAFGADHTFFSVQGTSGAIMTMVMAVCGPGDKILVPRNVHKSVMSAIILSGAHPIFMPPEIDERLGIAHGVSVSTVRTMLNWHPDARAVLVINPTYYGVAADLRGIVEVAHERNIPVLVDEAHGVHIHFHEELPLSAMQAGADMAATSVHKLGGSLTQSSILNVREGLVDPHHVQSIFSMLTTTSTSYLLLASLDTARRQLAVRGREMIDRSIRLAQEARRRINEIEGLYCFGDEALKGSAVFAYDPTKLTICVKDLGITGYDAERLLRERYGIEVELSDLYNVLCIVSPGDTDREIRLLIDAFRGIAWQFRHQIGKYPVEVKRPAMPLLAMSPREAFYADVEVVSLRESVGRIFAEMVMVYPPGIPILVPGEIVTEDSLDYIEEHMRAGLPVQGTDDPNLERVKVVRRPVAELLHL
ncbi:MAG: aminotransferase class I/II-fold pyridoxal phosphate-dependent enzyme [Alicyclobacillaceae bacterium]|nr:aminotransferase class I/II-fold pyridoxal phosphate-dependent enzyme [Alicyclobacillaceae bacterium]